MKKKLREYWVTEDCCSGEQVFTSQIAADSYAEELCPNCCPVDIIHVREVEENKKQSTFDRLMKKPKFKAKFDRTYKEFLLSEKKIDKKKKRKI